MLSCVREIRPREKPDRRLPDFDLRLSVSFTLSLMLEMLETQLSASLLLLAMASELQLSAQVTSVAEGMKSTDRSMKTVKLTLVYEFMVK